MSTSRKDKPMHPLALGFISNDGLLEAQDWVQVTLQTISCSTIVEPLAISNSAVALCQHHGLPFLSSERIPFPLQTKHSQHNRRRNLSALWRYSGRLPSLFLIHSQMDPAQSWQQCNIMRPITTSLPAEAVILRARSMRCMTSMVRQVHIHTTCALSHKPQRQKCTYQPMGSAH